MNKDAASADERGAIPPGPVMDLLELVLEPPRDRTLPSLPDSPERTMLDVYQSRFAPDGFLEWYPVMRRPMTETDFLRIAYRNTWIAHLCPAVPRETLQDGIRRVAACFTPGSVAALEEWHKHWSAVFLQLEQLAQQGPEDGAAANLPPPRQEYRRRPGNRGRAHAAG